MSELVHRNCLHRIWDYFWHCQLAFQNWSKLSNWHKRFIINQLLDHWARRRCLRIKVFRRHLFLQSQRIWLSIGYSRIWINTRIHPQGLHYWLVSKPRYRPNHSSYVQWQLWYLLCRISIWMANHEQDPRRDIDCDLECRWRTRWREQQYYLSSWSFCRTNPGGHFLCRLSQPGVNRL